MTVSDPSVSARLRRQSLGIGFAFGSFWIIMAIAALMVPAQDLWPALLCVGWAAFGGYIVGQTVHEWREERASIDLPTRHIAAVIRVADLTDSRPLS